MPAHTALFNQIQGGIPKLRKVGSLENRDKSDVEWRQREQTSMPWSDLASNMDGERESNRRKGLKEDLARRLGGR
jgi:hypothetical protein